MGFKHLILSFAALRTISALESYDYVYVGAFCYVETLLSLTGDSVIGGGTAGLTLANRLTENPKTSVIVLEAGEDLSSDPNVLAPGLSPVMYGNSTYDWNYHTVPQVLVCILVVMMLCLT